MDLKAMSVKCGTAVVPHGPGQEVILDIRRLDSRSRTDERAGFKVIGCAEAGFEQQPLQPDHSFAEETQA